MGRLYVEWTGNYPCLCNGEWIIKYDLIKLNVPKERRYDHMNTDGTYESLEDYHTGEFIEYNDGLEYKDWIMVNWEWVTNMFYEVKIIPNPKLLKELYDKIQENDWRNNSCGGCI